jgi:CHAT domain-containing protein
MLCATGAFSQLPIHAARASTANGFIGLTDYVVPSYTPTLGAVLNARRNYKPIRKSDAKVLLASVPNPYKWRPLAFAEKEVAEVEAVLPATSILRLSDQEGQGATVAGIQEKLPEASILHLACHGHQDPEHPLDSGFVMRDGMLTVADIMALRLPDVLLAFLSACETAKGDEKQPDQAVHLAAAMLFAGIKSVVGTMWCVQTRRFRCEMLNEVLQDDGRRGWAGSGPEGVRGSIWRGGRVPGAGRHPICARCGCEWPAGERPAPEPVGAVRPSGHVAGCRSL